MTLIGGQLLALLVLVALQTVAVAGRTQEPGAGAFPFLIGAITAVVAMYLRRSLAGNRLEEACSARKRDRCWTAEAQALGADRAGLHHGRVAVLLHLHHVHAEVPRQHGAYGGQDGQRRDDGGAGHLHAASAGVRSCFRPDRPEEQHAAVQRCSLLLGSVPLLGMLGQTSSPYSAFALVMAGLVIASFYTSISGVVKAELFPSTVRGARRRLHLCGRQRPVRRARPNTWRCRSSRPAMRAGSAGTSRR